MPTFSTLTFEEHVVIWAAVDLPTLLVLRSCSHNALTVVGEVLRASVSLLCRQFLDDTAAFLQELSHCRGVIGGQVAVRFMLRDLPFVPESLEVYVPPDVHLEMQRHLLDTHHMTLLVSFDSPENADEAWLADHALHYTDVLRTQQGRTIILHRCSEAEPLAAVACAPTSAEVTYVSPEGFGTAYPALLFQHRALVADWAHDDRNIGALLDWRRRRGIDLRMAARVWPEYRGMYCAAAKWVCHTQPRTFTDGGALAVRFSPLQGPREESTVMWRLDGRPCGGSCLHVEDAHGQKLYKYTILVEDGEEYRWSYQHRFVL
ncbi:hypothetical protein K466DRAFT_601393 [Polyporus arcularius HHB13444]|uniref:Uncharacterized protein n=1 Tax=Polyporus arcularius HHB13444 TaxID=1314778 RepID=A0A5C3P7E6_9APHY|nr:hypothetical protein K466DRAFT_601393 [Polyporus arcularius HHB13444]